MFESAEEPLIEPTELSFKALAVKLSSKFILYEAGFHAVEVWRSWTHYEIGYQSETGPKLKICKLY